MPAEDAILIDAVTKIKASKDTDFLWARAYLQFKKLLSERSRLCLSTEMATYG